MKRLIGGQTERHTPQLKIKNNVRMYFIMKSILFLIISLFLLTSCSNNVPSTSSNPSNNDTLDNLFNHQDILKKGKGLFLKYCIDCHSIPLKEEMPDLRTLLRDLPKDSVKSIVEFVYNSKNSNRKGGNILKKYIANGSMANYIHSFKDSTTIENVRVVVIYSWLASHHGK